MLVITPRLTGHWLVGMQREMKWRRGWGWEPIRVVKGRWSCYTIGRIGFGRKKNRIAFASRRRFRAGVLKSA